MWFRKSNTPDNYLYPGTPIAARVASAVLSKMASAADVVVLGRGTAWDNLTDSWSTETKLNFQILDPGPDLVNKVIGLASTGIRVVAFSTPVDAECFLETISRSPFPIAAIFHSAGRVPISDTTYGFHLSASTPQESIDLSLIAQRVSEDVLVPGTCAHVSFRDVLNVATIYDLEPALVESWLPPATEYVSSLSPAQELLFGDQRRRIPNLVDLDEPLGIGSGRRGEIDAITRAGIGPFFMDPVSGQLGQAFEEFGALTGRFYSTISSKQQSDSDLAVVVDGPIDAMEYYGSQVASTAKQRLTVLKATVLAPFPEEDLVQRLAGCRSVTVLDTVDAAGIGSHGLANLVRLALHRAIEKDVLSESAKPSVHPTMIEARYGYDRDLRLEDCVALVENMLAGTEQIRDYDLGVSFAPSHVRVPSIESLNQKIRRSYPGIDNRGLPAHFGDSTPVKRLATLAIVGHDIKTVSAVSESIAEAGFQALQQPVSTSIDRRNHSVSGIVVGIVSIGAISPIEAEMSSLEAIIATKGDDPRSLLSDSRLAKEAVLLLPTSQMGRFSFASIDRVHGDALKVLSVETGLDDSDGHVLMALAAGWLSTDTISKDLKDKFWQVLLTRLAGSLDWNEAEQQRASHLLVSADVIPWSGSDQDNAGSDSEAEPVAPSSVRQAPDRTGNLSDASRLWRTVGYSLDADLSDGLSPDPFISSNTVPARTGTFRSSSDVGGKVPTLYPENCTGCNACAAFCPEGAIRASAQSVESLVKFGIEQVGLLGKSTIQLDRISKPLVKKAHGLITKDGLNQYGSIGDVLQDALEPVLEAMKPTEETKRELLDGFQGILGLIGALPVIKTESFFEQPEAERRGAGELFLLSVDPDACNSCGVCVSACSDDALEMHEVSDDLAMRYRALSKAVVGVQPGQVSAEYTGSMDFLMGQKASEAVLGSNRTSPGSGSKISLRLICALIESEIGPRFDALAREAGDLSEGLRTKINELLHTAMDVNDFEDFSARLEALKEEHLTATDLADLITRVSDNTVDSAHLGVLTSTLGQLESLKRAFETGSTGDGRARLAAVFGSGPTLASNRIFPFNPYPFPWVHIDEGSPVSVAEGIFDGVMSRMCTAFSTLRIARRLSKGLTSADSDSQAQTGSILDWTELTDDEWAACPPVCVFTEDEADIPRSWLHGRLPINIFVLDGSGMLLDEGWGMRLWPLARPDWFVLHSTAAAFEHFSAGIKSGIAHKGPAVFRLFAPEPRLHGFEPDQTGARMLAAVRSRAFPLLRYDPDTEKEWTDRWSLDGNENIDKDWGTEDDTLDRWMSHDARFRDRSEAEVGQAKTNALGFWRLLQELSGIRSTALDRARREAQEDITRLVEDARKTIESEAHAEVDRVRSEHAAIYHAKLKQQLLRLSGFGPSTEASLQVLEETISSLIKTEEIESP